MKQLHGIGVALVTPMTPQGEVDENSFVSLLNYTSGRGVDYFVVQGTTGESATCTVQEKNRLLQLVRENNPRNLPIVYGHGGNNTYALVEGLQEIDLTGVAAVLSVSPYYNKPSQRGLVAHYTALAEACPVPIIIYNVPGRTGQGISAATTIELAQHPNIIGTKEASGSLKAAIEIVDKKPKDFLLISGDDMLTLPLVNYGAVGVISVLANGFPQIFRATFDAVARGELVAAGEAITVLQDINPLMYAEGNPVGIKECLRQLKVVDCNQVRLPLVAASPGLQQDLATALQGLVTKKVL